MSKDSVKCGRLENKIDAKRAPVRFFTEKLYLVRRVKLYTVPATGISGIFRSLRR